MSEARGGLEAGVAQDADPAPDPDRREPPGPVRRAWRVPLVALLAAGVVGAATWVVFFSPLLGVDRVEISGNDEIPDEVIRRAAGVAVGEPLAKVDVDVVRARIAALPPIEWAGVERGWPGTLRIRVRERTPIAVAVVGGRTALVDRYGVVVSLRDNAPPGLPRLVVPRLSPDDPTARAALAVIHGMPQRLARRVEQVQAASATSVTLSLADGRTVTWGDADHGDLKARVLLSLLQRPGKTFDVSSPDVAVVR
ncbi:FtsQ-type POTRA domain-containing protein [Thermopolyspora sp. NPDC052614]|uniref:cell division protein FtsQ/DivIB n=1 Tax=Thermopolyspora sp. NPDC052614 TaxID=3155682 RepID=UPI0034341B7C